MMIDDSHKVYDSVLFNLHIVHSRQLSIQLPIVENIAKLVVYYDSFSLPSKRLNSCQNYHQKKCPKVSKLSRPAPKTVKN
jgi:hypothetical protein